MRLANKKLCFPSEKGLAFSVKVLIIGESSAETSAGLSASGGFF